MFANAFSIIFIETSIMKCIGKELTVKYQHSCHSFRFALSFMIMLILCNTIQKRVLNCIEVEIWIYQLASPLTDVTNTAYRARPAHHQRPTHTPDRLKQFHKIMIDTSEQRYRPYPALYYLFIYNTNKQLDHVSYCNLVGIALKAFHSMRKIKFNKSFLFLIVLLLFPCYQIGTYHVTDKFRFKFLFNGYDNNVCMELNVWNTKF